MKKFLSVVGLVFLCMVVAGAALFGYLAYQARGLDASSKAYVEQNVPPIISTWSKDELLKRSSPQLLKVLDEKPDETQLLLQKFSKLGSMLSFGDVKGDANVSVTTQNGKVVTASYTATAKFQNGDAQVRIKLIQSATGEWQILMFYVNSPLFLK